MIGRLSGTLVEKNPPQILLEVCGVAYEVDVPMSTFYNLPAVGEPVILFTHLVVREDAHLLFGFASESERRAFRQLIKISGIGARTALSVLSGLSVVELAQAVTLQEPGRRRRHHRGGSASPRTGGRGCAQRARLARLQRQGGDPRRQGASRGYCGRGRNTPRVKGAGQGLTSRSR